LRLSAVTSRVRLPKKVSTYDDISSQAPELAHDRDRDPGDSVRVLFQ
jgi:hypothetical protein